MTTEPPATISLVARTSNLCIRVSSSAKRLDVSYKLRLCVCVSLQSSCATSQIRSPASMLQRCRKDVVGEPMRPLQVLRHKVFAMTTKRFTHDGKQNVKRLVV